MDASIPGMHLPEETDDTLVAAALAGNEDAYAELVRRYLTPAYNLCHRLTGNPDDASDAAQEAFVKAWKHLARFRHGGSFRAWVLRIAHNSALDILRKRRDIPMSAFDTDEGSNVLLDTTADTEPTAFERAVTAADVAKLDSLLATLAPAQREVLSLYFAEHLTFREIGEITGEPLDTVKSRHRRAVQALQRVWESAPEHSHTT